MLYHIISYHIIHSPLHFYKYPFQSKERWKNLPGRLRLIIIPITTAIVALFMEIMRRLAHYVITILQSHCLHKYFGNDSDNILGYIRYVCEIPIQYAFCSSFGKKIHLSYLKYVSYVCVCIYV